jgi:hypothetical protein
MKWLFLLMMLFIFASCNSAEESESSGDELVTASQATTLSQDNSLVTPVITYPSVDQKISAESKTIKIKWTSPYTKFLFRVQNMTDPKLKLQNSDKHSNLYFSKDNFQGKEIELEIQSGHSYEAWIHGISPKDSKKYSRAHRISFSILPLSCGDIPHLGSESRVRFSDKEVPSITDCLEETQTRKCVNGSFSDWTGSYTGLKCLVEAPRSIQIPKINPPLIDATKIKVSWSGETVNDYIVRLKNLNTDQMVFQSDSYVALSLERSLDPGEYLFWIHAKGKNFKRSPFSGYGESAQLKFTITQPVAQCAGPLEMNCDVPNGKGIQTRSCKDGVYSSYSSCAVVSCNAGFKGVANVCVKLDDSKFKVGDKVKLIRNTNVRRSAEISAINLLGQRPVGAIGTLVSGPTQTADNISWWFVDFDGQGHDGFSGEDNFELVDELTCDGVANGGVQEREMYQSPQVAEGQKCVSQKQNRSCHQGKWSAWSGSYQHDSCSPPAGLCRSISQFGVTWTFDKDYQCGQFVNGDYWVVGPVVIKDIFPKDPTPNDAIDVHGTMINPAISAENGWDSRIKPSAVKYNAQLNMAKRLPNLNVSVNSSVMSAISFAAYATGDNPQMESMSVLTVLSRPAPLGAFRPPYQGTDKTLKWNVSQMNYGALNSLPKPASAPPLHIVESYFERPWIEKVGSWSARYLRPFKNHPFENRGTVGTYAREMSHTLAAGLLSLQLNYSQAEKRKLLIRMVQIGLDIYGAARIGGYWEADGGQNQGRKMPMLMTGLVLNDSDILLYADAKKKMIFQEDAQTFYVKSSDVTGPRGLKCTNPNSPYFNQLSGTNCTVLIPYTSADIGLPEWGVRHLLEPNRDNKDWGALYREVNGACIIGHVLTGRLMQAQSHWNHSAIFDYYDRYWQFEGSRSSSSSNSIQPFVNDMWKAYRPGH